MTAIRDANQGRYSQIHGDDPVEFGFVIAFDRTKLAFDTGIIEKGVDAPEGGDGLLDIGATSLDLLTSATQVSTGRRAPRAFATLAKPSALISTSMRFAPARASE